METKYSCQKCNYFTNVKQNFDKHILTRRHELQQEKTIEVIQEETKKEQESCKYICPRCNKKYKCYSGLWNHRQKCKEVKKPSEKTQEKQSAALKEVIMLKDKVDNMGNNMISKEEFNELKNMIIELMKRDPTSIITNNSNNTNNFNISIFLNEKCKNAKNMIDFVREITIDLKNLLHIGENGYVDGVSKLLKDKLNDCHIHERPMHYYVNDAEEKKTIHIRDENKWKDDKIDVKEVFDKSINLLDRRLEWAHSTNIINPKMTKEVWDELKNHNGLMRENIKEQKEIISNITPAVKVP